MNSTSRLACWLVMEALILAKAQGETTPTAKNTPSGNDFAPLPGIFNSELPRMTLPADLRVTLRPRFGDLKGRDHLRLVWGLRYGLSPQWELSSDIDSYLAHGLKDRSVLSTNGISQVSFGASASTRVSANASCEKSSRSAVPRTSAVATVNGRLNLASISARGASFCSSGSHSMRQIGLMTACMDLMRAGSMPCRARRCSAAAMWAWVPRQDGQGL